MQGNVSIQTVVCSNNICDIQVPAPGFALVSFITTAFSETTAIANPIQTYSTTTTTGWLYTNTGLRVDPTVLATSNGHRAAYLPIGGRTSRVASLSTAPKVSTKEIIIITCSIGGFVLLVLLSCCWACIKHRVVGKFRKLPEPAPAPPVNRPYIPFNKESYQRAWDEAQREHRSSMSSISMQQHRPFGEFGQNRRASASSTSTLAYQIPRDMANRASASSSLTLTSQALMDPTNRTSITRPPLTHASSSHASAKRASTLSWIE